MSDIIFNSNPTMNNSSCGFTEGLANFIKSAVKEAVTEAIQDKMCENLVVDQHLTTKQLCERWDISDTTLLTWEKRGVISPIQTGGRKKLYSLKDVRAAEVNGFIKNVA
ncbi:MAG: MerR family transcriptional regulator [Paramuribaculum sp.]|nr:MerR family transcriptional regulator [Paramuribaculum sp.]